MFRPTILKVISIYNTLSQFNILTKYRMEQPIGITPFYTNKKYIGENGETFEIVGYTGNNVTIESNGVTRPGTIINFGKNNGQDVYRLRAGGISKSLYDNNSSYGKSRKMARKNRKSRNARRNRRNYSRRI
jgi:hypothetical protein